jgi:hypothetical protein
LSLKKTIDLRSVDCLKAANKKPTPAKQLVCLLYMLIEEDLFDVDQMVHRLHKGMPGKMFIMVKMEIEKVGGLAAGEEFWQRLRNHMFRVDEAEKKQRHSIFSLGVRSRVLNTVKATSSTQVMDIAGIQFIRGKSPEGKTCNIIKGCNAISAGSSVRP